MRKKNISDFDSSVKSLLYDAEEPVPSEVWAGISSRIAVTPTAAAPSSTVSPLFWRRAGFALAGACALAALVVFGFSGKDNAADAIPTYLYICQAEHAEIVVNEIPAVSPLAPRRSTAALAEGPVVPKAPGGFIPSAVPPSEESGSIPAGQSSSVSEEEDWVDPFARIRAEDAAELHKNHGRPSIMVNGILGGNDSRFGETGARPSRTSGESGSGIRENSVSTYGIPLSIGAGIRFPLGERLSAGVGLEWSLLTRSFKGSYNTMDDGDITHLMHYIGLPADLYYSLLDSRSVMLYAFAGGEAEYCLSNKYYMYSESALPILVDPVRKVQFSVNFGMGAEFKLADKLGLYMAPGASYYFPSSQPKSIRTDRPFMFNFDLGLRFTL